ncbi:putative WRKY transcription factor 4 [Cocos nucifera]|uniref:Putative WRKY transcription factor 4 n=1 Tax=Cocos nucifera TaxID=13894 RepID=A0A8K0MVC8_COCNU|nr:putative WRKY transcription factor 4 [Cocos nucifera]
MAEKRPCSDAPVEEKPGEAGGRPPSPSPPPVVESCLPVDPGPDDTPAPKESGSEAVKAPNSTTGENPAAVGADGRSFSQLIAGAMSSTVGSPRATPIIAVPVDAVRLPVVAVPCFLAPAGLLESPSFSGQFAMTHQAVLATVTAQAQMQLQASYPSSSSELVSTSVPQPISSMISPVPLQHRPSTVRDSGGTPETEQLPSVQKPQSAHIVVKTTSSDGGQHNHGPPQKPRCSKERAQSGGTTGENESLELPSSELNESEPSTWIKNEEDISEETDPKRRQVVKISWNLFLILFCNKIY